MKEIHDWAPWFRELARAVLDAGETGLITQASRVDWGGKPELLRNGDAGIDPFSFFYSLAQKSTKHQRSRVYPSVAKCFGLAPPPDPDNQDLYVFPTPTPQTPVVFNDRREFRADLLWRLFRQAVEDEPQIDPELFRDVLEIKFVAIVKLTQTLFLINPDYFVPADALQRLTVNRSMDLKRCGHAEYVSATGKAKRTFPECRPYEINAFVWFQYMSRSPLITAESRYFQVSTRAYKDDRWPDFDQSYAVYTDASRPGAPPGSWREETTDGDPLRGPYPLAEPNVMSDRAPLTPKDESSSETDRGSHNSGGGGTSGRLFQWRVFIPEAKLTRPVRHRAPNCTRPPGCGRAAKRTVPVQGASSESDRPVPPPPTPRKLEASR